MSDNDDTDLARRAADSRFIRERLEALDANAKRDINAVEDAYRRSILDLLRSRTPSRHTLQLTAGELERLWWPKAYKKKQLLSRARARVWHADDLVNYLADQYRKKGVRNPRTLAQQDAAKELGLSIAGLRKRRGRAKKRAGI